MITPAMSPTGSARTCAVVLDVDGTILDDGGHLDPEVERAMQRWWGAINFILASARPQMGLLRFYRLLARDGPHVVLNGAAAYLSLKDPPISQTPLSQSDRATLRELQQSHFQHIAAIFIYTSDSWRASGDSQIIRAEASLVGFDPIVKPEPEFHTPEPWLKLTFVARDGSSAACLQQALSSRSPRLNAQISKPTYVEVTHSGATKGLALSRLRDVLHLDSVVAIGDSENDLSMFTAATVSYAVATAPKHVREAARAVLPLPTGPSISSLIEQVVSAPPPAA